MVVIGMISADSPLSAWEESGSLLGVASVGTATKIRLWPEARRVWAFLYLESHPYPPIRAPSEGQGRWGYLRPKEGRRPRAASSLRGGKGKAGGASSPGPPPPSPAPPGIGSGPASRLCKPERGSQASGAAGREAGPRVGEGKHGLGAELGGVCPKGCPSVFLELPPSRCLSFPMTR